MEKKSPDAFRTISEVSQWLETPTHVLRFWESKFSQIKPVKRAGGRRYYRPSDMLLLGGIKKLLHEDGMTIRGAQKLLREKGIKSVSQLSQPLEHGELIEVAPVSAPPAPDEAPMAEDVAPEPASDNVVTLEAKPRKPKPAPEPVAPPLGTDLPTADPQDDSVVELGASLRALIASPQAASALRAADAAKINAVLARLSALYQSK